jgi:hypothetical protein
MCQIAAMFITDLILLTALLPALIRCFSYARIAEECIRQDISSQAVVSLDDVVFEGCQSSSNGGAVYIMNDLTIFAVSHCAFLLCSTVLDGGGIYFTGRSVSVVRFRGQNCFANCDSFCHLQVHSSEIGEISLNDSVMLCGECSSNTFSTQYSASLFESVEIIHLVNSTRNYAVTQGSGGCIASRNALLMQFCVI